MTRILGIDPGLNKTGWGVVDVEANCSSFVACGTISSSASLPLSERLSQLHGGLAKVIAEYSPDESAIEETFVNVNAKSSLKLGQARGALILTLSLAPLSVSEYSATHVKKTVVGVGRAEKGQVAMMVKILLPTAVIKGEDESDALAVALTHAHHRELNQRIHSA